MYVTLVKCGVDKNVWEGCFRGVISGTLIGFQWKMYSDKSHPARKPSPPHTRPFPPPDFQLNEQIFSDQSYREAGGCLLVFFGLARKRSVSMLR